MLRAVRTRSITVVMAGAAVMASCGSSPDGASLGDATTVVNTPTTSTASTTEPATTTATATTISATTISAPTTTTTDGTSSTTVAPATTALVPARDDTAISSLVECVDGGGCTQVVETPDGAFITLSLFEPRLVRVDDDGTTSIDADLGASAVDGAWIIAVGPDEVAYVAIRPGEADGDPIGDLLAVPTTGSAAGTVVAEWSGVVDLSGDTDLVPTARGLVAVGCCGPGALRPDPQREPVAPWVVGDGSIVEYVGPVVTMRTGDGGNELAVTDASGTRVFPMPSVAQFVRGMPWVQPLDDGGLVAAFFDQLTGASYYAVYGPEDAGAWNSRTSGELYVHSFFDHDDELIDGPSVLALTSTGEAVVRSDDVVTMIDVRDIGPRMMPLALESDLERWELLDSGANDVIAVEQPAWAASAVLVAQAMTLDWSPNERIVIETIDSNDAGDLVTLTITASGFLDDSTFASRWTILLERADDGLFRFVSGERAQQCQPGRGHQDFRPEICI